MKSLNQKGFSLVEGLLVTLILAIFGATGYYVYSQNKADETTQQNVSQQDSTTKSDDTEDKVSTELMSDNITEIKDGIELFDPEDVDKMPVETPVSFKDYMRERLSKENDSADEYGCYKLYTIIKVSALNIQGSTGSVDAQKVAGGEGCGGGAGYFWYLDGENEWKSFGLQSVIFCSEISKMKVYSEFIKECADTPTSEVLTPNPNGSLKDAIKMINQESS